MNLSKFNAFSKQGFVEECKTFFSAAFIALIVFGGTYAYDAFANTSAQTETLTVTIANAVTFNVYTDSFGTLTPGTPKYATSTTVVTTNANAGWNIQMFGTNQGSGAASTTLYIAADLATDNKIPDSTEWQPGAATTTAGNAGNATGSTTLAFRVMTASSSPASNAFLATTWWGTSDVNLNGNQKWAGVASTTASLIGKRIGIVKTGLYSASAYINTVQYYLDASASQKQGNYTGDITFTFTDTE